MKRILLCLLLTMAPSAFTQTWLTDFSCLRMGVNGGTAVSIRLIGNNTLQLRDFLEANDANINLGILQASKKVKTDTSVANIGFFGTGYAPVSYNLYVNGTSFFGGTVYFSSGTTLTTSVGNNSRILLDNTLGTIIKNAGGNLITIDPSNPYALIDGSWRISKALYTDRADVASTASITAMSNTSSFVKFTGSTATALHGIAAPSYAQRMVIVNLTGQNLTIKNESATETTAANRITTPTGADMATTANGNAELIYDLGSSRWICLYVTP